MPKIVSEFKKQLSVLITSALGFVAALTWNEAIKSAIESFVPPAQSWMFKILNAIIITLIITGILFVILRLSSSESA